LIAILPDNQISALPFLINLGISTKMLAFSFGIALLTGLLSGLVPALQASRPQLNEVLKEGGRSMAIGSGHRLRSAFVITEIALAVVLLVGAGLLLKSLMHILRSSPGFNPENLLTMTVVLPADKYEDPAKQVSFYDQLHERLKNVPGVSDVGAVNILPLQPGNTTRFYVEGDPVPQPGTEVEGNIRTVDETYFKTLGVPLIAGRMFDSRDKADAPTSVIIGRTIADKMFAGRDPVGRRLLYAGVKAPPLLVVGVVGDVKITGLDEAIRPVLYYPFRQNASVATNLVIRTSSDPNALAGTIREQTRGIEPGVAIFNVRAMGDVISASPAAFMRRFPATLITIFAGLSLLLSSIGIYGVISYAVSQQTHYIGIRMALGAQAFDILKMVLRQGLVLALIGIGIGVVAALAVTRLLSSLLFEVPANDITIFSIVIGTLAVVALLACYFPARRATKVDPLVALRYE
jgi:putative ABC transport system permease protein